MSAMVQRNTANSGRRRVKREPLAPGTLPPLFDRAMEAYRAQVRLPAAALKLSPLDDRTASCVCSGCAVYLCCASQLAVHSAVVVAAPPALATVRIVASSATVGGVSVGTGAGAGSASAASGSVGHGVYIARCAGLAMYMCWFVLGLGRLLVLLSCTCAASWETRWNSLCRRSPTGWRSSGRWGNAALPVQGAVGFGGDARVRVIAVWWCVHGCPAATVVLPLCACGCGF
jgi:hypothetical protein